MDDRESLQFAKTTFTQKIRELIYGRKKRNRYHCRRRHVRLIIGQ